MARTKGALNKRTRLALREAAEGKLEGAETLAFLVRIANDSRRDEKLRMEAASIALPYLRPKLSAVEQTVINPEESMTEDQIMAKLEALNRELVWALETMISGWVDPYDDNDNVAKARAILAKAKEVA